MLRCENVVLYRGTKRVLDAASFVIANKQKVGVVGANGAGKSSLLALVAGQLQPDAGEFERIPSARVAQVMQEVTDTPCALERRLRDFVIDGWSHLREAEAQLEQATLRNDGNEQARLLAAIDDIGGFHAEPQASRILSGLGFDTADHEKALAHFSGGWRMRAALARTLMQPSDLLLLDEPTNHLDLDAVLWLEDWLTRYPGTVLLISHDREFLNAVVDHVLHVGAATVTLTRGNYDAFERIRAEKLALQSRAYARQQSEVARLTRFVERFRYKASKARQAQSRLKMLERMQRIIPAHVDSPFQFVMTNPKKLPNPVIDLNDVSVGYGDHVVLRGLNARLAPGHRIGLLGRNGAGKSTFVKLLAGALPPICGHRDASPDLQCGYFAQHDVERLSSSASALVQLKDCHPSLTEQRARDLLGQFGFSGDDVLRSVSTFSGGERARLMLAMIFQMQPNLLLLDEPTNHLDLEMRQALAVALQDYPGAIVLVSHDRHLLGTIADELWLASRDRVSRFDGDLDDYAHWLKNRNSAPPLTSREVAKSPPQVTKTKAPAKLSYREQRELEALPARIESLEGELTQLQTRLADAEFLRGEGAEIAASNRRLQELEFDLARAYERWQELEDRPGT